MFLWPVCLARKIGNSKLSSAIQQSFCSLFRLLILAASWAKINTDNRAEWLCAPQSHATYSVEQVIKRSVVYVCMHLLMSSTKGCRDATRQTFLLLPGNPLSIKRGKCGCYDTLLQGWVCRERIKQSIPTTYSIYSKRKCKEKILKRLLCSQLLLTLFHKPAIGVNNTSKCCTHLNIL